MARSHKLIQTLKQQLRLSGVTYKSLAEQLNLSESAVKHMFANNNFSLRRLDEICEVLGCELSDVAASAHEDIQTIEKLSLELEQELINDTRLMLVAYCVMNFWSLEQIIERYQISETDCIQYLARLDKMKMIELQINNRVRLLVSHNFEWISNGPIERFFRKQVQTEFLNASFGKEGELRLVMNGDITLRARKLLLDRLKTIGEFFEELNQQESRQLNVEKQGTTMVLAIRQWEFQAFKSLER